MLRNPLLHAILWTTVLMVGFSIPGQTLQRLSFFSPDKLVHFGGFLILAILWMRAYPTSIWRIVVYGALFGFFVEVYQHLMPINRSFDIADALADFGGLLVGVQIGRPLVRRKKPEESEQL